MARALPDRRPVPPSAFCRVVGRVVVGIGCVAAAGLWAACSVEPVDFSGKHCPCDEGWFCDRARNTCVEVAVDAGSDGASRDAGPPPHDAGGTDAGPPDAGQPDASARDAGSLDGGTADAGPLDGGTSDAGPLDGGTADAGRPVTTVRITSLTDTYVDATMPSASFGSSAALLVDAEPTIYHTLIEPDLGALAAGTEIASATLELTCFNPGSEAHVYVVTEPWSPAVTWSTRPATEAASAASFVPDAAGRVTVDLTDVVQAWLDGAPNHGVLIRSSGTDGSDYRSTEHGTAAERPVLVVEHY